MELPLFPLNTVLFPGATLPLHIFEERYKTMVNMCLNEKRPFGVLLIRRGREVAEAVESFEVGTTAHIAQVQQVEEGRLNLICLGGERFRVSSTSSDRPYLVGEVELLATKADDEPKTQELAGDAGSLFAEYIRLYLAMTQQWARSVEMPSNPDRLADYIGSRVAADLLTKQRLLEELSARTRLAVEVQLLGDAIREMTSQVETARAVRWRGFAVEN